MQKPTVVMIAAVLIMVASGATSEGAPEQTVTIIMRDFRYSSSA